MMKKSGLICMLAVIGLLLCGTGRAQSTKRREPQPTASWASFRERCKSFAARHTALPVRPGRYMLFESPELTELLASADLRAATELLYDHDPKLRTLAACAIGMGDDPSLLPLLYSLLNDHAPTFDMTRRLSNITVTQKQDVSFVAATMIWEWTGLEISELAKEFPVRWTKVKDPERLLQVWMTRFNRVKYRRERGQGLEAFKQRLNREAPPWLRAVVALVVEDDTSEPIWNLEERYEWARRFIAKPFALACFHQQPDFTDPFFETDSWDFTLLCKRLLMALRWEPGDDEILLRIKPVERLPELHIAASRAARDNEKAVNILKQGIELLDKNYEDTYRAAMASELWDRAGMDEADYLIDRFYAGREPYTYGGFQSAFVRLVADSPRPATGLLGRLVRDERLDQLLVVPMKYLAWSCNKLAGEDVVSFDETQALSHPLNADDVGRSQKMEDAKEKYPAETEAMFKTLKSWRQRLAAYADKHKW